MRVRRNCAVIRPVMTATEMTMKAQVVVVCLLIALGVSGAQAQTRKTQQRNLERFEKYAGAPIESFEFWSLYKWQLVGPEKVVVWSTINDAYLITVEKPCSRLEWTKAIAVTSKQTHMVSSKFDYVKLGSDQCAIEEIRPIDYRRMIKDGPGDNPK